MQTLNTEDILKFSSMLEFSGRIAIITHTHPDGDALGSSMGMARFLRSIGKDTAILLPSPVPDTLRFMLSEEDCPIIIGAEDRIGAENALDNADLVLCLDFSRADRVKEMTDLFVATKTRKVAIDHHIGPDRGLFELIFSENEISSASELVFWILCALPQTGGDIRQIPLEALAALMTGMTTDSNNFANSTYPSTLEMASRCIKAGVDRDGILSELYNQYRENRFRLQGYVLSEKMRITPEGVAYFILSADELSRFDFMEGETEGFVNIPLGIKSVRMSIFLREDGDCYKVSTRSKRGTSARLFNEKWFAGGGHEQAAGGKLAIDERIPDAAAAEKYLTKAITSFYSNEK